MTFDLIGGPGYMAERITRDEVRALLATERAACLAIVRAEVEKWGGNLTLAPVGSVVTDLCARIIAAIEARHG